MPALEQVLEIAKWYVDFEEKKLPNIQNRHTRKIYQYRIEGMKQIINLIRKHYGVLL